MSLAVNKIVLISTHLLSGPQLRQVLCSFVFRSDEGEYYKAFLYVALLSCGQLQPPADLFPHQNKIK